MRTGLCGCGCGERTALATQTKTAVGDRKGEPLRFVKGHYARTRRTPGPEYVIDETTGCWVWQNVSSNGYGRINRSWAHRVYYERLVGPIPDGLQIDHLCRNTACVNPEHLEPVTGAENIRRAVAAREPRTHCRRGHPLTPENVYVERHATGERRHCRPCYNAGKNAKRAARRAEMRA